MTMIASSLPSFIVFNSIKGRTKYLNQQRPPPLSLLAAGAPA